MGRGNVDELLNQHGLSDTGTTKETNFSTAGIGSEQVDDFDTSLKDLSGGWLVNERRWVDVRLVMGSDHGRRISMGHCMVSL